MILFDLSGLLLSGVLLLVVSLLQGALDLCGKPQAGPLQGDLLTAGLRVGVVLAAVGMVAALSVAFRGPVVFEILFFGLLLYLALQLIPRLWTSPKRAEGFARRMAPVAVAIRTLLWPLAWVVARTWQMAERVLPREEVDMETIQEAIEATENQREEDKKILTGIVAFGERRVGEIMTPRVDVDALNAAWDFDRVRQTVVASSYSRLPMYEDSVDKIRGVVHIKDLLPYVEYGADFEWQQVARAAYFVPEEMKLSELLAEFQSRRTHMCIVVDEYGGTVGLATLEDVVEEVVGEISDESDAPEALYTVIGAGHYAFEGSFHLVDFERVLPELVSANQLLELLEQAVEQVKGDADTLAGLMIELKGAFFAVGEQVTLEGMVLQATEVEGYRITRVEVWFDPTKTTR